MVRRAWDQWGKRFKQEVDATSGLVGFAGGATAATGLALAAPIVAGLGAAVFVGTAAVCAWRSFPPKIIAPEQAVGLRIEDLDELKSFDPKPMSIGIIGVGRSGKSTLVSHLGLLPETDEKTEKLYFMIVQLQGSTKYFALVDGAGQQYAQQFKTAEASDRLIIFLDHEDTSTARTASADRLKEHERLIDQTASHLKVAGRSPAATHIVLNKRDLWQTAKQRAGLEKWLESQTEDWRQRVGGKVTSACHSNRKAADVTSIASVIREWLK